jgi:hypothetical protein
MNRPHESIPRVYKQDLLKGEICPLKPGFIKTPELKALKIYRAGEHSNFERYVPIKKLFL